jgi:hypothetical protein
MRGFVTATIQGSLREAMKAEVREVSAGMRRAVDRTGQQVQAELRNQARGTRFRDGGKGLANAWRVATYPRAGTETFSPAAVVSSNMPEIVDAFEEGKPITVKRQQWLVWPTGYNAALGRRGAGRRGGMRVTPEDMLRAGKGQAFIIGAKRNAGIRLWCLKVRAASGTRRLAATAKRAARWSRGRLKLIVGAGNAEVATAHGKGQVQRRKELLKQGFVPMFLMAKRVLPGKRLDVEGVRRRAADLLLSNMIQELKR